MNNKNQVKIECLGLRKTVRHVMASEASTHLGNAFREVLLAMRSAVDAAIKSKEQHAEAKFQKITVESEHAN